MTHHLAVTAALLLLATTGSASAQQRPNILFIFSDDHRHDALGTVDPDAHTPHLDALAASGVHFTHAFVTTAICSPSRAAVITGRYGSANGVTALASGVHDDEPSFARLARAAGYHTAHFGKWHLRNTPAELGFDRYARINSNGSWFQRRIDSNIPGCPKKLAGRFFETAMADLVIDQIAKSAKAGNPAKKPFLIWWCNQVPHLDGQLKYPVSEASLAQIPPAADLPVPANWKDDLASKPAYLATSRFVTKSATENYGGPGGYAKAANVRQHLREYHAAITDLDREIGRVLARLEDPDGDGDPSDSIADNTWVIFMGDNGWFTGHHRFTSKVLAYEESVRVPLIVRAPGVAPRTDDHLVLNIDLTQLLLDLAGAELPASLHGRNLRQLVEHPATPWRDHLYYEALTSELGSTAHEAVRTTTHKLIRTYPENGPAFTELYDLTTDPHELDNLAPSQTHQELLTELSSLLEQSRPPSD